MTEIKFPKSGEEFRITCTVGKCKLSVCRYFLRCKGPGVAKVKQSLPTNNISPIRINLFLSLKFHCFTTERIPPG